MTIYINDNDNNPLTPFTYTMQGNFYDYVVLGEGVDLNLNGFGVVVGYDSIGILSNSAGCEVYNGSVIGGTAGIHLGGAGSVVGNMVVSQQSIRGIGIAGGDGSVYGSTVGYIGSPSHPFFGAATGIVTWGNNNYIANNNVHNIYGAYESVAYTVGGSATMVNNLAQGATSTGWSFGLWISATNGTVTIDGMQMSGFNTGIGGYFDQINLTNSTIGLGYYYSDYPINDLGGNTITTATPNNAAVVYGTSGREMIVGGDGENRLIGSGGADTLFGGAGADTFVFSPGVMSVAPDYNPTEDEIYLAYHYPNAVVVFDMVRHVLVVDGVDLAFLPYADSVNYHF